MSAIFYAGGVQGRGLTGKAKIAPPGPFRGGDELFEVVAEPAVEAAVAFGLRRAEDISGYYQP